MHPPTAPVEPGRGDRASTQFSLSGMLALYLAHVVVWTGLVYLLPGSDRVSFEYLGALTTPWVRQFVLPLLVVFALQCIAVSKMGWWDAVTRDADRLQRQWLWAPVGLLVIGSWTLSFALEGFTPAGWEYVAGVVATVVLVGLCEELAFRGYLLVAARCLFPREWHAVVATSILFGLFHLPNALLGAPLPSELVHVVQTAVIGVLFYILRRLSGTLWVPVVVHATWDFVVLQAHWDAISALR